MTLLATLPVLCLLALSGNARECGFPGFNGHPLRGSVLAGGQHPFFAVMVADAGPTDRDGFNPLLGRPSRAGRDLAEWLQGRGIGSLRYDKRFIGSKDPRLDISLEAQSGDILAAIAAARALPEAKGKRILLVGHGEGALLALVAARQADAVLLLGMPGQSLRRQILDQVRSQFQRAGAPPESTQANLAHLEAVLAAIAEARPLPAPGSGVLPNVAALGRSLARPESLSFFRATLDLDPWLLASRVVVPMAAAWGGKDLQAWKPRVPPDFKGTVVDLPDADHGLRQELRPLSALGAGDVVAPGGGDPPLADLAPLARWLQALPGTPAAATPSLNTSKELP